MTKDWSDYKQMLGTVMTRDRHRLTRRLQDIEKLANTRQTYDLPLQKWQQQCDASRALVQQRQQLVPQIEFPDLPVCERREDIAALISAHQVVVIAGETGSGKTTQIPKICLSLGRGIRGLIGHTQPRRIAARSVSARIAEELGEQVGQQVGYQVRFTDNTSEATRVKVMTD